MDRNFRLVNNAEIVGCALILVLTRVDSHVNNLITNIDGRDLRMPYVVFIVLTLNLTTCHIRFARSGFTKYSVVAFVDTVAARI